MKLFNLNTAKHILITLLVLMSSLSFGSVSDSRKTTILSHIRSMNSSNYTINNIAKAITSNSNNDEEKLVAIYFWMRENISYDATLAKCESCDRDNYDTYEIVFRKKKGVCSGISNLTRFLSIENGLNAYVIGGKEDQDLFGERLFTDLSSILGEARKFAHCGDFKHYKTIDLKSSQFFFWTQLLNPEVIKEFLIKREPNKHLKKYYQKFSYDMKLIKDNKDIKLFQSAVKEGTLYDRLANRLNITRKEAKNEYFFPASFSKYNVNKPLKNEIAKDYPSFVKLVNDTNNINTPKLLPSILQKVESRILLDEVAVDLFNTLENLEEKYPFFTVHDAFYAHPDVYDLCLKTIKDSFIRLGLDVPIMSN